MCPDVDYVNGLVKVFHEWYSKFEQAVKFSIINEKRIDILDDLRNGGALAYREVKSETLPPLTHVVSKHKILIIKCAWKKDGTTVLKY